jgi:hypothetical protein
LDGLILISTDYSNSNEFLQFLRIERIIFHSKLPLETPRLKSTQKVIVDELRMSNKFYSTRK